MRLKTKQSINIKEIIILILLFIPISILSQDNKDQAQILVDNFIESYNNEEYNSVHKLFSTDLKKELPINELKDFLKNLNSEAGKIVDSEFIRLEDNIWIYKLTFEKWVSQYSFYINDNNEISVVFYFENFKDDLHSGLAVNYLLNTEKLITDKQTKLIFEKSKFFPDNTQISIAFINGNNINYYGVKRQNDSITYINNSQQIFEIGSITKVFTANILANAVIENKIKLGDNINDYLDLEFNNNTQISFNSLANHTSGLPRMPTNFQVEKLDSTDVVKVRHILIPYKGAFASGEETEVTKSYAKKTADSIFKEITKNDIKFESFLSFSSDTVVSNQYGEIEFTFFDGFEREFRDFSFENDTGSIDVIETVFGFHIIEILAKGEKKQLVNLRNLPENPYKYYDNYDLEDYLSNLLEIDKKTKGIPSYSNLGIGLLGYTLSHIYDLNYESLFKKYIFSKYNMKNSTFDIQLVDEKLVKGLDAQGNFTSNWELAALASAGGILSSVSDLAKYGIAHFDKSNLDLMLLTKKTVKVDNQIDMGLGWHIINSEKSDNKWYWHNGGTGGYTSSVAIDIKNKTGVVILSNVSAFNPFQNNIDELCFGLMMTFTDEKGKPYYN